MGNHHFSWVNQLFLWVAEVNAQLWTQQLLPVAGSNNGILYWTSDSAAPAPIGWSQWHISTWLTSANCTHQLVGGNWLPFFIFPFSWEFPHPNWRSPSFFRGVALAHQPAINSRVLVDQFPWISWISGSIPGSRAVKGGQGSLPGFNLWPAIPGFWRHQRSGSVLVSFAIKKTWKQHQTTFLFGEIHLLSPINVVDPTINIPIHQPFGDF